MGSMTYTRPKVAPWENWTDGEWHAVREGPVGEPKSDSLRIYRNHAQSLREWADRRGYRGQLSRRENGRILLVRLTKDQAGSRAPYVATMQPMSRSEIGRHAIEALQLLEYALHIRMYGERAPGGNKNWPEFDRRAELLLRKMRGLEHES